MGAFAGALSGIGNVGEDYATGKQTLAQSRQNQELQKVQMMASQLKLQQLQQQLGNTPEAQVAQFEKLLGRPLTDPEKSTLFGLTAPQSTKEPKTEWRVEVGADGKPHDILYDDTGKQIKDAGIHYEKPDKPETQDFGTQAGKYTTADGKSGYGYRSSKDGLVYDAATNKPVEAKSFVPSAEQPTTTSGVSFQDMAGPGGSQQIVAIPTTRTSGKGGGGETTIGKPTPIGQKALPPALTEKLNSMVSTISPVLDAMKRMRQNSSILSNPMTAMKIQMAASSGGLASLASRGLNLTDQEKQYAADYQTTAEGINALRQALQATGFRGPYAWETLLQQRGTLWQRPDVTNKVLDQSINILNGQLGQAEKILGGNSSGNVVGSAPASPGGFTRNADGSYTEQ